MDRIKCNDKETEVVKESEESCGLIFPLQDSDLFEEEEVTPLSKKRKPEERISTCGSEDESDDNEFVESKKEGTRHKPQTIRDIEKVAAQKVRKMQFKIFLQNSSNCFTSHHDKETQELSSRRCSAWFSSIERADIDASATFYRVCSDHFINGKPLKFFERNHRDWISSVNMGYSKKVESVSWHSRQLKRNLKKDYITHEDKNNAETQSLSNANQVEEPVNMSENIVDLINANENDEKSLTDFESTSFCHVYTQTNVTTEFIDL